VFEGWLPINLPSSLGEASMAVAGAAVVTVEDPQSRAQPYRKVTYAWTSDGAGAVSEVPAVALNKAVYGQIVKVVFVPDAVDVPTTLYDIQLKDENGVDVLNGTGTDIAVVGGAAVQKVPNIAGAPVATGGEPVHVAGKLQLLVAAAGAAKKGKLILLLTSPDPRR